MPFLLSWGDAKPHAKLAAWYNDYLLSQKWLDKKNKIYNKRGHSCEKCKAITHLVVHHKTYERVTHEWDRDLQILCKDCHAAIDHRGIPFIHRIVDEDYLENLKKNDF